MKQELYKKNMDFVREAPNYNRYLVENVERYLGKRVLDVGCGVGNTTTFIKNGRLVVGIDVSEFYLSEFKKNVKDVEVFKADIAKAEEINFLKQFHFDTIFCSNVLEHIKDDIAALRNMHRILIDNGILILLVPQYKCLYGSVDEADLHYRRYNKEVLCRKLTGVGFEINREFCINFPGIFWWYVYGKILRRNVNTSSEAGLINRLIPLIKVLDRLLLMSLGLSLIVIGEK